MTIQEVLAYIQDYRAAKPDASKQEIAAATAREFALAKQRSVYTCAQFSLRFSAASGATFSNVVLSLSSLKPVDHLPLIVVVVRSPECEFLLANSTFLKKISHSSHQLRVDNVRGSFLGHDIMRIYEDIPNRPENFEALFARHQAFAWDENLERLVEATNQIVGTGRRFAPTPEQREAILRSPSLAASLLANAAYDRLKQELAAIVAERTAQILQFAEIDNVNQRGNLIERSITGGINEHKLGDMVRHLAGLASIELEIKTKRMDRASSPKAYNIDKALEALARGDTVIAFCFVGVHVAAGRVTASTVSIFDQAVLAATHVQFHWAGRNSRGVTQLTGDFSRVFAPEYQERIDVAAAQRFLKDLLNL